MIVFFLCLNYKIVRIHGNSMYPTLSDGQFVIANTRIHSVAKGDIIVFKKNHITYIKRIAAVPGDRVEQNGLLGTLSVNGEIVVSSVANATGQNMQYAVPDNCYFVIGDNYRESVDSRNSKVGFVTFDEIIAIMRDY